MLPYYFYSDLDANNSKKDAASMMSNLDIMIYGVECCHIFFCGDVDADNSKWQKKKQTVLVISKV